MSSSKKSNLLICLFSVLFVMFFLIIPIGFSATGVLDNQLCANGGVSLFLMNADKNAHASANSADAATYGYSVCYSSPSGYSAGQILKPLTAGSRACVFANEVVSLSSVSNAHVESAGANTYDTHVCFDYLDCRVSASNAVADGEQILAKLSGDTNAHISILSDGTPQFNKYLICSEPICDGTNGRSTVYPLITGFETNDQLQTVVSGGAIASYDSEKFATGSSSLKISYPINAQLGSESVTINLGNKNNWAGFDYLEFYLYVEKSLGLSVNISVDNGASSTLIALDHSVAPTGLKLGWNLIQIPISRISGDTSKISSISFLVEPAKVVNFISGQTYVYYVDSIQLSSTTLNSDYAKSYCLQKNSDNAFVWGRDLSIVNSTYLTKILPLAQKTSSGKVCGDQPNEIFADGSSGCFESKFVTSGTAIDFLTVSGLGISNKLCVGNSCDLLVAPINSGNTIDASKIAPSDSTFLLKSYSVKSRSAEISSSSPAPVGENTLSYSLDKPHIVYGIKTKIKSGESATTTSESEQFYSCGNVTSKYSGVITSVDFGTQSNGASCVVVGGYTCNASTQSFVKTPSGSNGGNRCVNGVLEKIPPKQNYDGSEAGYCSQESQCFVTNSPSAVKPGCVDAGKFYQNYYCDSGDWSTRTAILAAKLINYSYGNDWTKGTLYCDDYRKTLNFVDPTLNLEQVFAGLYDGNRTCAVTDPGYTSPAIDNEYSCVNSFCVFAPDKAGAKPIFATSLNKPFNEIRDINKSFGTSCNGVSGNGFVNCKGSSYNYDSSLQLVLYNPNEKGFAETISNVLKVYLINPLKNLFTGTPSVPEQFKLAQDSKLYSKFYFTINPDVSITAFNEVRYNETLLGGKSYYVFKINDVKGAQKINLCDELIDTYNKQNSLTDDSAVSCSSATSGDGNVTIIVGDENAYGLWPKLTANLRLS